MEPLIEKLTTLLKAEFDAADVQLMPTPYMGKVAGFLVWSGFEGLEQIKRQNRLWKVLRKKLTPEELLKVSAILTFTPEEWAVEQEAYGPYGPSRDA